VLVDRSIWRIPVRVREAVQNGIHSLRRNLEDCSATQRTGAGNNSSLTGRAIEISIRSLNQARQRILPVRRAIQLVQSRVNTSRRHFEHDAGIRHPSSTRNSIEIAVRALIHTAVRARSIDLIKAVEQRKLACRRDLEQSSVVVKAAIGAASVQSTVVTQYQRRVDVLNTSIRLVDD